MPKLRKIWRLAPVKSDLQQQLSQEFGISTAIAQTLVNRGVMDESTAKEFLFAGKEGLGNPYSMKDMERAVGRIAQAINDKEKITVYGDYDVDGITASALVYKVLLSLGGVIEYYIPERQNEGYGLHDAALKLLQQSGTQLVITVDCGISAVSEITTIGGDLDIIITDHHQPPADLPPAYAIINPKQLDCNYPDKHLAGVGVAFKLCQAVWQHFHGDTVFLEYMDIVALGTIADIVPLIGENRILVKMGLEQIANTDNVGLKALLRVCALESNKIDTGRIGFVVAPRLNAAGRISHASVGVELLTTNDEARALELANMLNDENLERQTIEKAILVEAQSMLAEVDLNREKVLVLARENWHPGVIGIVASRLVEKYYRPVIMISLKDGIGKGSCRSIPGFDMYSALRHCASILLQFGGHHQAAGLSILADNIENLRDSLNQIAGEILREEDYIPVLKIDSLVPIEEINASFIEQLACLPPHGMGNPTPVFVCKNLGLTDIRTIGSEGKHLKLRVISKNSTNDVVGWELGDLAEKFHRNDPVDLAFFPEINEWHGQKNIQLRAYDVCPGSVCPDRIIIGQIYLTLKYVARSQKNILLSNSQIVHSLRERYNVCANEMMIEKSIKILAELNLLGFEIQDNRRVIHLCKEPEEKRDLNQSATFREAMLNT